ncbi:hypothetical protein [Clostridium weizhouense]|uniref:Lipoprotein n=1 Tax=Clostridium weizhouense TaxID=2859781 RepID=A0ABS7AJJ4_9CLOT|nr:hypothetical protein [Clostridium weizhouense]MBW6408802.1 hypothetical protein [Clostridium weizhouense]
MSKKICSIIITLLISTSLAGCINIKGNDKEKDINSKTKTEQKSENLEGSWAKNYSLDQTKSFFNSYLYKMEQITKELELDYSKEDVVKEEKDQIINTKSIYFDNKDPQANKMESMYFGMKIFDEDLSSGEIELKLSLKFDSKGAIENGDFDLGKTSFKRYIETFTGKIDRDYSSINKQIIDRLKNGESEFIIEDNIDGLKEEIMVNKEYIIYKLATKKYDFKNPDMIVE